MNRAFLQRLLMMAVVAPYLYKLSSREDGYFSIGLKLVAGGIIVANIEPLIKESKQVATDAKAFLAQVQKAQQTLEREQGKKVVIDAEDGEIVG